jgi:hypothetical protein
VAHHADADKRDLHRVSDPHGILILYIDKIEYIFYDLCKDGFVVSARQ